MTSLTRAKNCAFRFDLDVLTVHECNMLLSSWWPILLLGDQVIAQWIEYPDYGPASLTHYDLPTNFVAACGCTPASTHYPTAALSQLAYGSSADYGAHIFLLYRVIHADTCSKDPPAESAST